MPYCPECHAEYEDGYATCADCGRPLAAGRPPEAATTPTGDGGPSVPGPVVITTVPNAIIGQLLVGQLKDAGIPAMLRRSTIVDVGEWTHNDFVMQDLLVPASRAAAARQLITSPPGGGYGPGGYDPGGYGPGDPTSWPDLDLTRDPALAGAPEPPDGWPALPGESDYVARRTLRKAHGEGAGWGDTPAQAAPQHWPAGGRAADEDDGNWLQNRWVRVITGLLFLVMTLPWLLQLFQQLQDALNR